jgi:hypothetical protein
VTPSPTTPVSDPVDESPPVPTSSGDAKSSAEGALPHPIAIDETTAKEAT